MPVATEMGHGEYDQSDTVSAAKAVSGALYMHVAACMYMYVSNICVYMLLIVVT